MGQKSGRGFWADFRRFFVRGLATLLPTVLTIVLLVKGFQFVQENISVHITGGVLRIVVLVTDDYPKVTVEDTQEYLKSRGLNKETVQEYTESGALPAVFKDSAKLNREVRLYKLQSKWGKSPYSLVGFIIAIILTYIAGRLVGSYLGRRLWHRVERAITGMPIFKQVYPNIKQVTDFLFGENKIQFTRVVAAPYPSKEIWSVGLVTGPGFRHISQTTGQEYVTVFIPSSPTPMTGYVVHVKKSEIIDLPISIEEALRFTISGGVIAPTNEKSKDKPAKPRTTLSKDKDLIGLTAPHGSASAGSEASEDR